MSAVASPMQKTFERDGYLVVRGLIEPENCQQLRSEVEAALSPLTAPVEYEADVGYPGAPHSRGAAGGNTPRRLLYAYGRHPLYRALATGPVISGHLSQLTRQHDWMMSQCHHNCVMTKAPGYSSETHWHQDIRYWSFDVPELISVWVALGEENARNGALSIIPGSHSMDIDRGRLDRDLFLRPELPANSALIDRAQTVDLAPGDVLFFHCRAFHAAGCNRSTSTKLSCVFTYHRQSNRPIPGTRSSAFESVPVPTAEMP